MTPTDRAEALTYNLRWTCQWLSMLNRGGFPSVPAAEAALGTGDGAEIEAAAKRIVTGTQHLGHPSLDALRAAIAESGK